MEKNFFRLPGNASESCLPWLSEKPCGMNKACCSPELSHRGCWHGEPTEAELWAHTSSVGGCPSSLTWSQVPPQACKLWRHCFTCIYHSFLFFCSEDWSFYLQFNNDLAREARAPRRRPSCVIKSAFFLCLGRKNKTPKSNKFQITKIRLPQMEVTCYNGSTGDQETKSSGLGPALTVCDFGQVACLPGPRLPHLQTRGHVCLRCNGGRTRYNVPVAVLNQRGSLCPFVPYSTIPLAGCSRN